MAANYNSFDTNDLHNSCPEEESTGLLPAEPTFDIDVNPAHRVRTNRNRLISIVSLVLALVGVTLLVSLSKGTVTSSSVGKVAELHSFDTISTGN